MHQTGQERVPEDRGGHRNRLRNHGLHRFLRQTDSYTDQQYHRQLLDAPSRQIDNTLIRPFLFNQQ